MSDQPVLLQLPEELYARIRQIAEESQRPVESVLVDSLSLLFGELPDNDSLTPEMLSSLTDEQLWAIVHRHLAWALDSRLRELSELGKTGQLSAEEYAEMESLVEQTDRHILLRSQALLLLKQRGYDVEHRLKMGA
ncbi:MAG: hypothetical protein U0528_06670 [Anaerolineae bacterium]|nr:hypothetical protein [Anaerolineae bacterium]